MKIFNNGTFAQSLRKIVGEIVNITYNKTYYVDGVLQDKPKTKHNLYICESIEYEIIPNMGYLYLYRKDDMHDAGSFSEIDESTVRVIAVEFGKMLNEVVSKFGYENVSIPIAQPGTTQYLLMNNPADKQQQGVVKFTENIDVTIDNLAETDFVWQIISKEVEIPYVTPNTTKSLASIIFDEIGIFDLPDGYRNANFPSLAEYKIATSGRLSQNLLVANINLGLTFEIPKHYMPAEELDALLDYPKKKTNKIRYIGEETNAIFTQCQRVIHFVKYEWLRFYESDKYSDLNIYKQVKYGMFDKELDPDDERTSKPVCFITGIPIYGDCYVFDIYRQQIEEMINEDDLDKYPNAKVITEEMEAEEKEICELLKSGRHNVNPNDPYYYAFPSEKEDIKELLRAKRAAKAIGAKAIGAKGKKKVAQSDTDADQDDEPEKKKSQTPKILKRGVKISKQVKMIKIRYWKDYDTKRCVLISSWYMHLAIKNGKNVIYDKVNHFENMSGCRVVVYRTFCPVTCEQVITESNATDLDKKIMLAICQNGRFGNKLLMAETPDNVEINLHADINMGQLVTETISGTSIMGKKEIIYT